MTSLIRSVDVTYQLGVDLGTTFTAAAISRDGQTEVANLGDRSASIPSVVSLRADASVVTGEAAERRALTDISRVAREFKRRIGDPVPILLGGAPFSAEQLMAELLRATIDRVGSLEGRAPQRFAVTHPANWGPYKIDLLAHAVHLADLPEATYLTEPEAAAIFYASSARVDAGETVAVYDLGGGTFDAAVLRKTATGFEILGQPEGIERLGGIDFDSAVYSHVRSCLGAAFDQLDPDDPATMAAVARLRQDCIGAKEALSADTDVSIAVLLPTVQTEVRLRRAEFEEMVRPALSQTVSSLRRSMRSAGVDPTELKAVLLIGGSSRIPLVGELVAAEIGSPVAVDAHPKYAVALGAAVAAGSVAPAGQEASSVPIQVEPAAGPGAGRGRDAPPSAEPSLKADLASSGFWFYVDRPQVLVSAADARRSVARLSPGTWYQAHSEHSGWVWACDEHGTEGWVSASVIHRYA